MSQFEGLFCPGNHDSQRRRSSAVFSRLSVVAREENRGNAALCAHGNHQRGTIGCCGSLRSVGHHGTRHQRGRGRKVKKNPKKPDFSLVNLHFSANIDAHFWKTLPTCSSGRKWEKRSEEKNPFYFHIPFYKSSTTDLWSAHFAESFLLSRRKHICRLPLRFIAEISL